MAATDSPQVQLVQGRLAKIFAESVQLKGLFDVNMSDGQQVLAVSLYLRILELSEAISAMLASPAAIGIPILTRTVYEAFTDLKLLCDDKSYVKNMIAQHLDGKRKILEHAEKNPAGEYHAAIAAASTFRAVVDDTKTRLKTLKEQGVNPISEFEKAQKIGMSDQYRSIYWLLSQHTHSEISILDERHLRQNGERKHLVCFEDFGLRDVGGELLLVIDILEGSPRNLNKIFKDGSVDVSLEKLHASCEELRAMLDEGRDAELTESFRT